MTGYQDYSTSGYVGGPSVCSQISGRRCTGICVIQKKVVAMMIRT